MSYIVVLSRDPALRATVSPVRGNRTGVATRTAGRLTRLVRERPATAVVVDSGVFGAAWEPEVALREIATLYPSVGTVLVARRSLAPLTLLRLGRAGFPGLHVIRHAEVERGLDRALALAEDRSTRARTLRRIGSRLATRERSLVAAALDGVLTGWGAEDLARRAGWTRAHLGVRLRDAELPSPGRLLLWARILHAARWLPEPGRTAESVSRQLAYANGATFRRALRTVLGCTPSELIAAGGFRSALARFLDVCGLGDSLGPTRSVA